MPVEVINPDSAVLSQVGEYWQKLAAMLVWKLARKGVKISVKDMDAFQREYEAGGGVLLTHGHHDSIEFKIVTRAEAERIAAYDATQRGTA